ncbi:MAG: tetratricopeptide repeat protein, partial [Pirellulales bacterium]|nr:tetratricopeptide repeat protein [Pirellulales bacterium]
EQLGDAAIGHYYLGSCRMRLRNRDKTEMAKRDFSRAIERNPNLWEAYLSRGLARELTGDLTGALEDLGVVLQSETNASRVLLVRSRVHRKLGNLSQSRLDYEAAIHCQPTTLEDWVSRALARLSGDPRGALDDLQAAEKIDPTSPLVLQNQAHVLSEHLGQPGRAIECLTRLISHHPSLEKAIFGRAVLYARTGKRDLALGELDWAEKHLPHWTAASLYQAACVHALLCRSSSSQEQSEAEMTSRHSAFQYLSQALQDGYGADLLDSDPDLVALRDDDSFRVLREAVQMGHTR